MSDDKKVYPMDVMNEILERAKCPVRAEEGEDIFKTLYRAYLWLEDVKPIEKIMAETPMPQLYAPVERKIQIVLPDEVKKH